MQVKQISSALVPESCHSPSCRDPLWRASSPHTAPPQSCSFRLFCSALSLRGLLRHNRPRPSLLLKWVFYELLLNVDKQVDRQFLLSTPVVETSRQTVSPRLLQSPRTVGRINLPSHQGHELTANNRVSLPSGPYQMAILVRVTLFSPLPCGPMDRPMFRLPPFSPVWVDSKMWVSEHCIFHYQAVGLC